MTFKESSIVPYFQPIISVENNKIYGYEVLGRHLCGNTSESLGFFFNDTNVSSQEKLEVDRIVRRKAIKKFATECFDNEHIFINMRLDWISKFSSDPENMPTIGFLRENAIDFDRVVIEISEDDISASSKSAIIGLSYYQSLGIKVAIDKYGKKGSNIYQLAEINPSIIKIDMSYIQESEKLEQYREYLKIQTEFAEKLGIEVVYQGIENENQLNNCINASGRFFQGYFLALPRPDFMGDFREDEMKYCFIRSVMKYENHNIKREKIRKKLDLFVKRCKEEELFATEREKTDENLVNSREFAPEFIKRIYICNKYGYQTTSNIEFLDGTTTLVNNYGKNWAWRGYFEDAIDNISDEKASFITHAYIDISTKEKIYTYVNRLDSTTYFFADISLDSI